MGAETAAKYCWNPQCYGLRIKVRTERETCLFCDSELRRGSADFMDGLGDLGDLFNPFGFGKPS